MVGSLQTYQYESYFLIIKKKGFGISSKVTEEVTENDVSVLMTWLKRGPLECLF